MEDYEEEHCPNCGEEVESDWDFNECDICGETGCDGCFPVRLQNDGYYCLECLAIEHNKKEPVELNMSAFRGFNIWVMIWDFTEWFYKVTGFRVQAPIEIFFPDFGPWLFGKIIGKKGEEIE